MKRRHGARFWSMAVVVALLIAGVSGPQSPRTTRLRGNRAIQGHWDVTINPWNRCHSATRSAMATPRAPIPQTR